LIYWIDLQSIEINKADIICCGTTFSLQTFDILRLPWKSSVQKNFDILQRMQPSDLINIWTIRFGYHTNSEG